MGTPEVIGYQAVRQAARDYERYSSDLQGDRDVRDYRQYPLETDPPRHALYRDALQPLFLGASIAPHAGEFEELARRLVGGISARGGGELGRELALPYVMGCLTIVFNRPQDLDEWVSWGPDVWTAEAYQKGEVNRESLIALRNRDFSSPSQRSGRVLQAYLERVFGEAERLEAEGAPSRDIWDHLQRITIDGRRISRPEKYGMANVLLAGGRETVIKLLTGMCWHLIRTPQDRDLLTQNPSLRGRAIAELARFLSPLPKIERLEVGPDPDGAEPAAGEYRLLNWASANHDTSIWENPDVIDLRRERKPHLAFGFGRHSCLGMNLAEHEARALLEVLLADWPGWVFAGEPELSWMRERREGGEFDFLDRFDAVNVVVGRSI